MRHGTTLLAPLALALAACVETSPLTTPATSDGTTAMRLVAPSRGGDRLATVEWEGRTPRLYLQDLDGGNRVRVTFAHVSGHVTGNYTSRELPVTDETITRITGARWSPDGRFLAVIVAPSTEALQVVLVSADGRALRTVSPNSQYLWGDAEWSPDGSRIAYIMATGPYGKLPDIFVTELGPDLVTRVTTGAQLSGFDAIRFDASGTRIHFTERLGWANDGVNGLARLASVDLATGTITRGLEVAGEPQGIARDGSWALFVRSTTGGTRELFRLPSTGGAETVLATGDVAGAEMTEGDDETVMIESGSAGYGFSLIGLAQPGDLRAKLSAPLATWASAFRAAP